MSRFVTNAFAIAAAFAGMWLAMPGKEVSLAGDDQSVLQTDRAFVEAAATGDKARLATLVDSDFTWTDAEGKTQTRAEILESLPKPALGDESGAPVEQRTYGQVGAVMSSREKIHVLRIWVKRAAGWRALVYHEVALSQQPSTGGGSVVADCQNPCKTLPFKPKTEAERAIIASWQALETGVTNHDAAAWAPHIADDFVMLSTANDHPMTKSDRIATLNLQKQTGRGSAPAPLVSAHMFDFGDAVVMTCLHEPYTGKPVHVSRLWIKRDGRWVMSISYQTTIQAAPAKVS
jgi:Domain of unknown function (DUF4440)